MGYITVVHGNILKAPEQVICQQVNCKGVMGSGLAKQIRAKWPKVYDEYKKDLATYDRLSLMSGTRDVINYALGKSLFVQVEPNKWIANLYGQDGYGRTPGIVYTNIKALTSALVSTREQAERMQLRSVAIPAGIGSGLGGANKEEILQIIHNVFNGFYTTLYEFDN